MQYVTTRNNTYLHASVEALSADSQNSSTLYVPAASLFFSPEQIASLAKRPFGQCVADILNLLFDCQLSSFDIDFTIGRCPVQLPEISRKIVFGDTWNNFQGKHQMMLDDLYRKIAKSEQRTASEWFCIAERIAVLFGIFGKLMRKYELGNTAQIDVAVFAEEYPMIAAAWYAKSWGLPIGKIICCGGSDSSLWDLMHHGYLRTNIVAGVSALERILFDCGGELEAANFVNACRIEKTYTPSESTWEILKSRIYVSVVSEDRVLSTIPNLYHSKKIILDPCTALTYCGLLDYRINSGSNNFSIVVSENGPESMLQTVAYAMGISEAELLEKLNL